MSGWRPSKAEFLRTDDPPVRDGDNGEQRCDTCASWSRWLPETGDCLLHALRRREALIAGRGDEVESKSARVTSGGETCDGWSGRAGMGLSR